MARNYKIEDEDWELVEAEDSKNFVLIKYTRSHENYEYDQSKKEIYRKTETGLELICLYETGVLGGSWTGCFYDKLQKFDDLEMFAGNHAKRNHMNTGTKGYVENIYLKDDKIVITNKYQTGKWSRIRDWTIEKVEEA